MLQGMDREHFTLEVENVGWVDEDDEPEKPRVVIAFDGEADRLEDRLTGPGGTPLAAEETDAACRLQGSVDDATATEGVVSITNRLTGEFIIELNADAEAVLTFVRAARGYGDVAESGEGRYEVTVIVDDEEFLTHDKGTFLVYDEEGKLLRQHSLIPSGVEL